MDCVDDEVPGAVQPVERKPGDGFHMMEKAGTYHLSIKGNVKWSVMVLPYMKQPKDTGPGPGPGPVPGPGPPPK